MKRLLIVLAGTALTLSACVRKQVVLEAEHQCDSLVTLVGEKDSLINAVFEEINSISENLAQIKSRENLISVAADPEGVRRPVAEINRDIEAIDRLMQENKKKIASLQRTAAQLRKANVRIEALDRTIADLNGRLDEQAQTIAALRGQLDERARQVEALEMAVAERTAEIDSLSDAKIELESRLSTVYYIVGPEKELRDAQIINKQGFIGRTLTMGRAGNLDSFTQVDARLLGEIPVGHRRVTVVSSHPAGSYELVMDRDKVVEKLVINDPERFWETSKVLVVSYK